MAGGREAEGLTSSHSSRGRTPQPVTRADYECLADDLYFGSGDAKPLSRHCASERSVGYLLFLIGSSEDQCSTRPSFIQPFL